MGSRQRSLGQLRDDFLEAITALDFADALTGRGEAELTSLNTEIIFEFLCDLAKSML